MKAVFWEFGEDEVPNFVENNVSIIVVKKLSLKN